MKSCALVLLSFEFMNKICKNEFIQRYKWGGRQFYTSYNYEIILQSQPQSSVGLTRTQCKHLSGTHVNRLHQKVEETSPPYARVAAMTLMQTDNFKTLVKH